MIAAAASLLIPGEITGELLEVLEGLPGYSPLPGSEGYYFDPRRAARVESFFERCCSHIKGPKAGQPLELENWQRSILYNLYGWVDGEGLRRYLEALLLIPRKNGKTLFGAGCCLYSLLADGEAGAECYSMAASRDQASLAFDVARRMALANKEITRRVDIWRKSIVCEETASFYRAVSSDADKAHGNNAHFVLDDELHAQQSRHLLDAFQTGMASRPQPILLHITTADFDRPSICNEKREYAAGVRDGLIRDHRFLPVIYEAPAKADPLDPKTWAAANPNLGVSITPGYLEREAARAEESPAYRETFKRLHLNIKTETHTRWIHAENWKAAGEEYTAEELKGLRCWGGLDLAASEDITALVLCFPLEEGRFRLLPFFWVPEGLVARRAEKGLKPSYRAWVDAGEMFQTPGAVTDYDLIRGEVNKLAKRYRLVDLAVDRLFQGAQLAKQLQGDGLEITSFGQGFYSMASPTNDFERLYLDGKLAHPAHPVLDWMAGNVTVEEDPAGNRKPAKNVSSGRIDGIVASIMALGIAIRDGAKRESVYKKRGVRVVRHND